MVLENNYYLITAEVETKPLLSRFDIVHHLSNKDTDDIYMARIFNIRYCNGTSASIAFVDFICASYEPFAVLEEHCLTSIFYSKIVQFDLQSGQVTKIIECDNWGGLFQIHRIQDGYIIWGECDIFRYDLDLNRIWHFMGRDMLVSQKYSQHFWIDGNTIHCRDFEGWHYILNLDGKLLDNFKEFDDA